MTFTFFNEYPSAPTHAHTYTHTHTHTPQDAHTHTPQEITLACCTVVPRVSSCDILDMWWLLSTEWHPDWQFSSSTLKLFLDFSNITIYETWEILWWPYKYEPRQEKMLLLTKQHRINGWSKSTSIVYVVLDTWRARSTSYGDTESTTEWEKHRGPRDQRSISKKKQYQAIGVTIRHPFFVGHCVTFHDHNILF